MKIIITESQEKNLKQRVIFKFMDLQKLHQIEIDNSIYFVKKVGDEYAKIRYDKSDGWNAIDYDLELLLSDLTNFQHSEVKELIGLWVENTLQMKVTFNTKIFPEARMVLRIPYK
jgi:hypothetical protein